MPSGTNSIAAARSFVDRCTTPHPKSVEFADAGLEAWMRSRPEDDTEALADSSAGKNGHFAGAMTSRLYCNNGSGSTAVPCHQRFSGPSRNTAKWRCGASADASPVDPT